MRAASGEETDLRACISTERVNAVVARPMKASAGQGRPSAAASRCSAHAHERIEYEFEIRNAKKMDA